jgi:hypothetical protein
LTTAALPSAPPQLPQVLTSGADIFFFVVVLVDVSAEDIYWEEEEGGGERESSAHSSDKSRGILSYLNGDRSGFAEGVAKKYLAQLLFVRKAGGKGCLNACACAASCCGTVELAFMVISYPSSSNVQDKQEAHSEVTLVIFF